MSDQDEMVVVSRAAIRDLIGGLTDSSHFHGSGLFPTFCCATRRSELTEALLDALPIATTPSIEITAAQAARKDFATCQQDGYWRAVIADGWEDFLKFATDSFAALAEVKYRHPLQKQFKAAYAAEFRRLFTQSAPLDAEIPA